MADKDGLLSVDYEIYGKVQGVFFRKYTQRKTMEDHDHQPWFHVLNISAVRLPREPSNPERLKGFGYAVFDDLDSLLRALSLNEEAEAKKLGLVGWVQNTSEGTVHGQLQGPSTSIRDIQTWLENKGSPKSRISRAEFRNERRISKLEHSDFNIVK